METMTSRVSNETIKKGTDIQSANTIKSLMDVQEDHFSVRILPRYDLQKERFLPAKLKKIYPIDPFTARVWVAIGSNIRRLYDESLPLIPLDECAFATQMLRAEGNDGASYLYSDTTKSEVDFYFQGCGFELKSGGHPTPKQKEILRRCSQSFSVTRKTLPLMAYLVGEGR
jgi:predicted AAA+ superfamily ATPase